MPNKTYQTKPTKPNRPIQTYKTKPTKPNQINLAYQAYWTKPTKPKLLVKAVNAWVRSAFGNVFSWLLHMYIDFEIFLGQNVNVKFFTVAP